QLSDATSSAALPAIPRDAGLRVWGTAPNSRWAGYTPTRCGASPAASRQIMQSSVVWVLCPSRRFAPGRRSAPPAPSTSSPPLSLSSRVSSSHPSLLVATRLLRRGLKRVSIASPDPATIVAGPCRYGLDQRRF